jgi:PPOX class probable F420-dependent enzyme
VIDTGTQFGARADRRLREEVLAWLVTVRADGQPQPSPIWFLWEGESCLFYSQRGRQKLRNIERNPLVSLHLDGDGRGGDVVIVWGEARVSEDPPADQVPEFVEKYAWGFERLGMSAAEFAGEYSVPIRIAFRSLHGH